MKTRHSQLGCVVVAQELAGGVVAAMMGRRRVEYGRGTPTPLRPNGIRNGVENRPLGTPGAQGRPGGGSGPANSCKPLSVWCLNALGLATSDDAFRNLRHDVLDVVEYSPRGLGESFCRSLRVPPLRRLLHLALWAVALALVWLSCLLWRVEAAECPRGADEWDWVSCDDGNTLDGYWQWGYWVPGLVRTQNQFEDLPLVMEGRAVWYGPQVMEATAEVRGLSLHGYLDGVASMSCADVGLPYWINRGFGWEGPYLVVDCPQLDDMYSVIVYREEVVEVGWRTAERWGIQDGGWFVTVSRVPPAAARHVLPVRLRPWFEERVEFHPRSLTVELDPKPIYRAPSTWRLDGEWVTFKEPEWDWPSGGPLCANSGKG